METGERTMTVLRKSPRVVLIDDDDLVRATLVNALDHAGFDVVAVVNGDEGLRQVIEKGADIVITDILMPEKDGIETIIQLRKAYPDLKIIAMSGGGQTNNTSLLGHARQFGADATLTKPFTLERLRSAIDQCGFGWNPRPSSGGV
jgi:CheY-like chemotaxis protein